MNDGPRVVCAAQRKGEMQERVGALDGLRGLALIAVLLYHAAPEVLGGGFLGVEMFFVLSGFLLISLLLAEEDRRGLIDPWGYASRRLRRLAPALVVMLMALAVVVPLVAPDDAHRLTRDIGSSLLGLTNWHLIADGASYFGQAGRPSLVRHLWSIAVEAQVYLCIPFVAAFLARTSRRRGMAALVVGIAASATAMTLLYVSPDPSRAYYGTDARVGALLTGALVAMVVRAIERSKSARLTSRATAVLFVGGVLVVWVLFVAADERARILYPAGFLGTQLATAALIVAAVFPGWPSRVFAQDQLRWIGVRSYGIYLWHWPIVALLRPGIDVAWPAWATACVSIAGAFALGTLSYRFIERPFLSASSWARRPLPMPTRIGAISWVTAIVVVAALVGRTSTVDPIAESIRAGEQALAEQEAHHAASDDGTDVTSVGTGNQAIGQQGDTPRDIAVGSGPKKGTVTLSAVGDSVMLGAAKQLKSRFGAKSYINAEINRRWRQAPKVVKAWRKSGKLGKVLVLHLGHNGPMKVEDVEAVLKEAKPTKYVLLVTVRVDKPWQKAVNDVLRYEAKKHEKVWLVDWHGYSSGRRDWFYSDATHMNIHGAKAYTKLIASKIPKDKPAATKRPKVPSGTSAPTATPTPGAVEGLLKP